MRTHNDTRDGCGVCVSMGVRGVEGRLSGHGCDMCVCGGGFDHALRPPCVRDWFRKLTSPHHRAREVRSTAHPTPPCARAAIQACDRSVLVTTNHCTRCFAWPGSRWVEPDTLRSSTRRRPPGHASPSDTAPLPSNCSTWFCAHTGCGAPGSPDVVRKPARLTAAMPLHLSINHACGGQ